MKLRKQKPEPTEPYRRLSPWRVLLAICVLAGLGTSTAFAMKHYQSFEPTASSKPWFAPYVDVTATPTYAFEQAQGTDAILSFIVSSPSDPCTPSWGGAYTMDQASSSLDLDRRIARLRQQGGNVGISFGGLLNDELALKCTDSAKLQTAYQSVIDRYKIDTIDFDLEGKGLNDLAAGARRAEVAAKLQAVQHTKGKNLAVWVTLAVTPQGLTENGTNGVAMLLSKKVDLAGVNAMTMDYGQSRSGKSMLVASQDALTETQRQLGILYQRSGINLNSETLWSKIGATPMIGQNDESGEIFTLEDAVSLNKFALSHGIGRMSMWSANRDLTCGSNYIDVKVVSDSCSGIKQNGKSFTILGDGFDGNISLSSHIVTTNQPAEVVKADNPADSPYQIWSESGSYLQGTKVVWHHNVYEAKWWTHGDLPDSPVLQSWQTPWTLIGPVLPGEKPTIQTTLPVGTFPVWSGNLSYDTDQRVLFDGIPYQAKWWNKGQSPAAASSSPDSSPWVPLTQAQVNEVAAGLKNSKTTIR